MLAICPNHLGTVKCYGGEPTGLQYCVRPAIPVSFDQVSPSPIPASVVVPAVCFWRNSPQWARASSFTRFLDHRPRRTTAGRTLWTSDQGVADIA